MLVQALAKYADTYLADDLADVAFEEKPINFTIIINADGKFVSAIELASGDKKGSKPLRICKSPVGRTSGVHPLLTADSVEYVLGPCLESWTEPAKENRHQEVHEGFIELISDAAAQTNDEALLACEKFYATPDEVDKARQEIAERGGSGSILIALAYQATVNDSDKPVIYRKAVRDYWIRHFEEKTLSEQSGGEGYCIISGKYGPLARTHPKIKGAAAIGGQASGVSLMSFDKDSFKSYNWHQNANAPVGLERASAYTMALTNLLIRGKHQLGEGLQSTRHDYGNDAFLFWTKEPTEINPFSMIHEPEPDQLKKLLASPETGYAGYNNFTDENLFYFLIVSGNGGRLVVKNFYHDTLANVKANLVNWFESNNICDVYEHGELAKPPKITSLFWHVSTPAERKNNKYSSLVTTRLIARALFGKPVGFSLLSKTLSRLRSESSYRLSPQRMGLIRLIVNDVLKQGELPMKESLDTSQSSPAYICGRLLAEYESLQYAASGNVGVTVADRYYAMASTYPQLAFPSLERLSKAHMKKLKRDNKGAAWAIDQRINELAELIQGEFPSQLSLVDQGRFVLGYHHQKAENSRRAKQAKQDKLENQTEE